MINVNIPNKVLWLYEVVKAGGKSRDIADTIFDWAVYFDCPDKWEDCDDYYDKVMLLFALNIEVESTNDSYIICKVTDFIERYRQQFDEFFNRVHKDEWQPRNMDFIEEESEEFYDFYLSCFESLVSGGYSIDDYKVLYNCLVKEGN